MPRPAKPDKSCQGPKVEKLEKKWGHENRHSKAGRRILATAEWRGYDELELAQISTNSTVIDSQELLCRAVM